LGGSGGPGRGSKVAFLALPPRESPAISRLPPRGRNAQNWPNLGCADARTHPPTHPPTHPHTHTHTVHTYWTATPYWLVEDAEGRLDAIEAAVLFARYAARLRTREWRRTVSVPTPRHDSNESETLQLEPNQLDGKHVSDRNRKPLAADIRILPACRDGQQATESAATPCFKLPWSSHHEWQPMTRHKSLALD
jgi:hypothetical protein